MLDGVSHRPGKNPGGRSARTLLHMQRGHSDRQCSRQSGEERARSDRRRVRAPAAHTAAVRAADAATAATRALDASVWRSGGENAGRHAANSDSPRSAASRDATVGAAGVNSACSARNDDAVSTSGADWLAASVSRSIAYPGPARSGTAGGRNLACGGVAGFRATSHTAAADASIFDPRFCVVATSRGDAGLNRASADQSVSRP